MEKEIHRKSTTKFQWYIESGVLFHRLAAAVGNALYLRISDAGRRTKPPPSGHIDDPAELIGEISSVEAGCTPDRWSVNLGGRTLAMLVS